MGIFAKFYYLNESLKDGMTNKKKVFLGGTCNTSTWRHSFIEQAQSLNVECFNPVVADWTPAHQEKELHERQISDFVVYTITPKLSGVYSIAEAVDDSNKRPSKTIFIVLQEDAGRWYSIDQEKSLRATAAIIKANGGFACTCIEDAIKHINENI
jgi:hypothetical protein